ncbi:MAG: sodium:solute symporter, partial [Acidobacteria bacterium]|nr:sodium:solute symporter [Acidobacteriota bacterium]
VPVLFGTFLEDTPLSAAASAAVTAVAVHFGLYYTGQHYFPYYEGVAVKNPGISTALGIVAALAVGGVVYLVGRKGASPAAES